jgi:hypothetical protein
LYCLQDSATSLQYAAFFADCQHELTPLTAGMRLVLAYNLVFKGPAAAAPRLAGRSPAEVRLQHAVQAWQREIEDGGTQKRIAFLLDEWVAQRSSMQVCCLAAAGRAAYGSVLPFCCVSEAHTVLLRTLDDCSV